MGDDVGVVENEGGAVGVGTGIAFRTVDITNNFSDDVFCKAGDVVGGVEGSGDGGVVGTEEAEIVVASGVAFGDIEGVSVIWNGSIDNVGGMFEGFGGDTEGEFDVGGGGDIGEIGDEGVEVG
ncbi:hypothetical protein AGMMS50233_10140 [Endomicrobiia bacterium]|nr:hypothetical protein AGMMS50233_10140 [Endomicrobiia bacterium]